MNVCFYYHFWHENIILKVLGRSGKVSPSPAQSTHSIFYIIRWKIDPSYDISIKTAWSTKDKSLKRGQKTKKIRKSKNNEAKKK